MHTILWLENHKERNNFEDLGVDGKITLEEWILRDYSGSVVDWMHLA